MNFQEIILRLDQYWAKQGCAIIQPYDLEKGAGTFNPATFFGSLTSKSNSVAYVEPCRRPGDGQRRQEQQRAPRRLLFQQSSQTRHGRPDFIRFPGLHLIIRTRSSNGTTRNAAIT